MATGSLEMLKLYGAWPEWKLLKPNLGHCAVVESRDALVGEGVGAAVGSGVGDEVGE